MVIPHWSSSERRFGWVGGWVVVGEGENWLGGVGWGLGDGSGDGSKDPPLHLAGAGGGVGEGVTVEGGADGGNGRGGTAGGDGEDGRVGAAGGGVGQGEVDRGAAAAEGGVGGWGVVAGRGDAEIGVPVGGEKEEAMVWRQVGVPKALMYSCWASFRVCTKVWPR
jgi:hypothetical protein